MQQGKVSSQSPETKGSEIPKLAEMSNIPDVHISVQRSVTIKNKSELPLILQHNFSIICQTCRRWRNVNINCNVDFMNPYSSCLITSENKAN